LNQIEIPDLPELKPVRKKPKISPIGSSLATSQKSRLIAEYLRLFVYITKSGYYLDLFSGPQDESIQSEDWSFRRVVAAQPPNRCLNGYFLFEQDPDQFQRVESLNSSLNSALQGRVHLFPGDCNLEIGKILRPEILSTSKPAFALLDQRTMECNWRTVEALADYKREADYKIELFYFLANKWLPRTIHALQDDEKGRTWWGSEDFRTLLNLNGHDRAEVLRRRIENELGYEFVTYWPITESIDNGGQIAYFMIHATDHFDAPGLMRRAYERSINRTKPVEQAVLLEGISSETPCDTEKKAFQQGKKSWKRNRRSANPFSPRSPFGRRWQEGFETAEKEAYDAAIGRANGR